MISPNILPVYVMVQRQREIPCRARPYGGGQEVPGGKAGQMDPGIVPDDHGVVEQEGTV